MSSSSSDDLAARVHDARARLDELRNAIGQVIVGQRDTVDAVIAALLAGGHVLLEGAPGLGKTLLVRTLASALALQFGRVQFTPDLLPTDIVGTQVMVQEPGGNRGFAMHKGPIFCQVLLADEINRASPRTQSALLEAMQERAVTVAGVRHSLGPPFMVLATENPIEMEGTYPLPEAQLDRFLFKVIVHEPSEDELVDVLMKTTSESRAEVPVVLDAGHVAELQSLCRMVTVADPVARYVARVIKASNPTAPECPSTVKRSLRYGAGVRGAQSLLMGAKAMALMEGRLHAGFGDVVRVAPLCLRHRLLRSFEADAEGVSTEAIIEALLGSVERRGDTVERALREPSR